MVILIFIQILKEKKKENLDLHKAFILMTSEVKE